MSPLSTVWMEPVIGPRVLERDEGEEGGDILGFGHPAAGHPAGQVDVHVAREARRGGVVQGQLGRIRLIMCRIPA